MFINNQHQISKICCFSFRYSRFHQTDFSESAFNLLLNVLLPKHTQTNVNWKREIHNWFDSLKGDKSRDKQTINFAKIIINH